MLWQVIWNTATLICSDLRDHYNVLDFFDLIVVRRRDSVKVTAYLYSEVANADESLQNILGYHIGHACFSDVIRVDKDLVRPQMQSGR